MSGSPGNDRERREGRSEERPEESEEGEVERRLAELEEKNREYLDRLKRLQAEFENYKKRSAKERQEIAMLGIERLVRELLTLLDDFERALKSCGPSPDTGATSEGLEMMYKHLKAILSKEGVAEIDVGCKLDPYLHDAVSRVEDEEYEDEEILACVQKGYKMGHKVIRPAKVIVCSRPVSGPVVETPQEGRPAGASPEDDDRSEQSEQDE